MIASVAGALRHRRVDVRDDRGVSLAELLVTMMVFAILLTITGGFMVAASKASTQARAIDGTTRSASNAMNAVSRNLRAATDNPVAGQALPTPSFQVATPTDVRFYAFVNLTSTDATPVMVRYWLDGTSLRETTTQSRRSTDGYYSFTGTSATRTVASSVVPGAALFTYLDAAGTALDPTVLVTTEQRRAVAAVRVRVQIGTGPTDATATTLVNTVGLPNLDLFRSAP